MARENRQRIEAKLRENQKARHHLDRIRQALPVIARRQEVTDLLAQYENAPVLASDFAETRRDLVSKLDMARREAERADAAISTIEKEMAGLLPDDTIINSAGLIEELYQQLGSQHKAAADRVGLDTRRSALLGECREILRSLSDELSLEDAEHLRIKKEQAAAIRRLSSEYEQITTRMESAKEALPEITRYPDGNAFHLKQKLAERLGVSSDCLTLGNGSNDVLEIVARAFAEPGTEVVYSEHAFAIYPIVTQAIGATGVQVPAVDWGHDLDAMADAVTERTRVVFVANPNNPTGTVVEKEGVYRFLKRIPEDVIVVLDEAYCEYLQGPEYADGVQWLSEFPNLIVSRTFSKAWGLSGLRVGYGISSPEIADVINRVRQPFNTGVLAQAAATAVLDDHAYLEQAIEVNRVGLEQLRDGFGRLGLDVVPSVANFVAVDTGRDANEVHNALIREGVIVRPIGAYGMPRHLRVSVGLESENRRCLDAMKKVLS
jgi:histidinol-phosphate aminotransferase